LEDSGEVIAVVDQAQDAYSRYVAQLLENEYLQESVRLAERAAEHHDAGRYVEAEEDAREAIRFAQLSDEYVMSRLRIREAEIAIAAARARLDWARRIGAAENFPEIYEMAGRALADALIARGEELNSYEDIDWEIDWGGGARTGCTSCRHFVRAG